MTVLCLIPQATSYVAGRIEFCCFLPLFSHRGQKNTSLYYIEVLLYFRWEHSPPALMTVLCLIPRATSYVYGSPAGADSDFVFILSFSVFCFLLFSFFFKRFDFHFVISLFGFGFGFYFVLFRFCF